ncbi:MAG: ATP-binding cassette domain-containing protein [Clostridia bacterium]|nr:ATP-binding cassette domain-containing protein [Clostridia bacterium]
MLKLIDLVKTYGDGETSVHALNGINLEFQETGIVSILGQSGCGKTTMLNIIGGLDQTTSGKLIIDDVDTSSYSEKDWNNYRNKNIGFVFQNYYLIPHLNVLENVMMPMSLAGETEPIQKEKALEALKKVGLQNQIKKKPKQISGGQAQRVAIARSIVNKPKIILADEPTGALDSENSIQILELLKELSKSSLVIIVTHNEELANTYSDRIIKMKDGIIIDDISIDQTSLEDTESTNELPIVDNYDINSDTNINKKKPKVKKNKTNLRPWSAFVTSFKNLYYKKGRTIITALAGCIGIISIFVILAFNSGFKTYATDYQKKSLAKYPITITKSASQMSNIEQIIRNADLKTWDMSTLDSDAIYTILKEEISTHESFTNEEIIYVNKVLTGLGYTLDDLIRENDTEEFKKYIDSNFNKEYATVKYNYGLNINAYRQNKQGKYDVISPLGKRVSSDVFVNFNSMISTVMGSSLSEKDLQRIEAAFQSMNFFDSLVSDQSVLDKQYDLLAGSWPQDDVENKKFECVIVVDQYNQLTDASLYALGYISFFDLLSAFLDGSTEAFKKLTNSDDEALDGLISLGKALGKPLDDEMSFEDVLGTEYKILVDSDYYSLNEETNKYVDKYKDAMHVNGLLNDAATLTISGIIRLKPSVEAGSLSSDIGYTQNLIDYMINKTLNSDVLTAQIAEYNKYIEAKETEGYARYLELTDQLLKKEITMEDISNNPQDSMIMLQYGNLSIKSVIDGKNSYNSISDYESAINTIGYIDLSKPKSILFYPTNVESVDKVIEFIGEYNNICKSNYDSGQTSKDNSIDYENELDTIMTSATEMINTISYILIAVTALAVVVSLFMVAIIMYISVQDRTKEIGIMRSMGARKIDIMNIFNIETIILGLMSGLLGIALGYALTPLANIVLFNYLEAQNLVQPVWWHSLVLIGASICLTTISGLIPAILASRKNPVIALRTE